MASFDENPIIELGKTPIPGASPCGQQVAEDDQFIELDAEMTKVGRIEADEPDWYVMEQHGINLLRTKCKDFEVGSALGHALFQLHSYAGLSAWLAMTTEMVRNFWDDGFPTRIRRRKARIETLPDRFPDGGWFSDHPPKPDDFDALDKAVERIEELDAAIKEKLPDDPGDFAKFKRGLKDQAAKRPAPQAVAPPPAASGDGGGGGAAATGTSAGSFSAGEVGDVSGALNAILAATTFLKKADPTDPISYAVARIMKWSKISLPTSDEAKYQIPPPESSTIEAMAHQMGGAIWENLLKNAEAAFRSNDPLWLDLQRYVCAAMAGLGPTYEHARETVMGLTASLVRRLGDGIFELTFRGGTPLCSGDTKMWIDAELGSAEGSGGVAGASGDNGKLVESASKAKKLAGSGKLKEAIAELSEGLRGCTQRRDRFLWKLCIARLCFDAKRLQLAAPLLEECHEEIRRHQIDEWEPSLAVDVAQTLYRCRKQITSAEKSPAQDALQGVRDSYAWLCQLDPLAALAAEPSGK